MEILIKISQFLLSLSILIVLHELGHFIPAKLFKTRVEKFYLFFDPWISLIKFKKGETEYGIGWLPLGGYVKISGMIDESMDKEQMNKPPEPWEFRSKPSWQRLIIMMGGVTVNVLLAVVIYWMILFATGSTYLPNESLVDGVWCQHEIATELGFKNGDKLISVDGEKEERFTRMMGKIYVGKQVLIERDGKEITIDLPVDLLGQISSSDTRLPLFIYRMPFFVGGLIDGFGAAESGLMKGDKIVGLNGQTIKYFDEFKSTTGNFTNNEITVTVERDGTTINYPLQLTGDTAGIIPAMVTLDQLGKLGTYDVAIQEYGFFEALPVGISEATETLNEYLGGLKKIFSPKTGAYKGVGGFLAIIDIFPGTWNWLVFWKLTAFLSLMLAVLNLLPIPALDGGHVMFLLYEMVAQRKPNEKFMEYAQITGMVLILLLFIFANGNDIQKLLP